jgi:hypothetical protein
MLSCCTRRSSLAVHVQGLLGAPTEDTSCHRTHGYSALEGVEAREIGIELVDSRHLQLVGKTEGPGAVGELVDEQTVVVVRIGKQNCRDQSSPSGPLEGEEHVPEGAKEYIAGIVVDGLRKGSDHQGYRCASVL